MAMELTSPLAALSVTTSAVIRNLSTTREPPWAITSYGVRVLPSTQERHSTLPTLISTVANGLSVRVTISDTMNMALPLGLGPGTDVEGPQPPSPAVGSLLFREHPSRATLSRTRGVRALHYSSCKARKPPAVHGVP